MRRLEGSWRRERRTSADRQGQRRSGRAKQARTPARVRIAGGLIAALALVAIAGASLALASSRLKVYDEGHLHYLRSSGNQLIDEGHASGTVPGTVVVHFTYTGNPTVYASFQIHARAGTITGTAKGHLSNPNSPTPSFSGALRLSGGGGHYAHAHGSGELYGVFDRRNYAMTVQTRGTVSY